MDDGITVCYVSDEATRRAMWQMMLAVAGTHETAPPLTKPIMHTGYASVQTERRGGARSNPSAKRHGGCDFLFKHRSINSRSNSA